MLKNKTLNLLMSVFVLVMSASVSLAKEVLVTNHFDSGAGSFRNAIEMANFDSGISDIRFDSTLPVYLTTSVHYTGQQSLTIHGDGVVLDGHKMQRGDLFLSQGAAPLVLKNMTFQHAKRHGVGVQIPGNSLNNVSLYMEQVNINHTQGYGLYINDSSYPESKQKSGAKTGVILYIRHSHFRHNGDQTVDKNAIRIDEYEDGGIYMDIAHAVIEGNKGDGIKLNENGDGDVILSMKNTMVNGSISSSFISVQASNKEKSDGQL